MADLKAWSHGVRKANCSLITDLEKQHGGSFVKKGWIQLIAKDECKQSVHTEKYWFDKIGSAPKGGFPFNTKCCTINL